jgi:hypothetical protein
MVFLGFAKRFGCHPVTTPFTALTRRNILLTYNKDIFKSKFISKISNLYVIKTIF